MALGAVPGQIGIPHNWSPRDYQQPSWDSFDQYQFGVDVWHRRGGKDSVLGNRICLAAHQRTGVYWHMLPTQKQARKAVWNNVDRYGRRMIDQIYPPQIRAGMNSTEMLIELKCGSFVQLCGSDNYDSLVGSNPIGVGMSEYSVGKPAAWNFLRPILRENGGWARFIYTPRGRNHGFKLYEMAKNNPDWWCQKLTVEDTGVLGPADIQAERDSDMPEAMIRQEYYCDFNALNHGVILADQMEEARAQGRINMDVQLVPGEPLHAVFDIGRRDATAVWFIQAVNDGFWAVDYVEATGHDAETFIDRVLAPMGYPIDTVWLPHDAKVKTFQSRHSVVSQFIRAKGAGLCKHVKLTAALNDKDKVNAARWLARRCHWNSETCIDGIEALEAWAFEWDEDRKEFSLKPDHNWASHPGDSFAYAGTCLADYKPERAASDIVPAVPADGNFQLDKLWSTAPGGHDDSRLP